MVQLTGRAWTGRLAALIVLCLLIAPGLVLPGFAFPASASSKSTSNGQARRDKARSQFERAERLREELNGLPRKDRSRRAYERVTDAYRSVYHSAPDSSKADASVLAVAELLAECGRAFDDEKILHNAVAQYEFLRREYPGSKYRFNALFTIGQIYKQDLRENDKARAAFQEVITRYPRLQVAADAHEAITEMDQEARGRRKAAALRALSAKPPEGRAQENKLPPSMGENSDNSPHSGVPLVTGIRHWSTPDYTRVAIDLEQEVKYEAGRVPSPDRIFFDLHDVKLASTLVGKNFEVSDSFLHRVRVAQYQRGMVRVVLEVDAVADYSAFLLPNPYRLIIDIHGRKPEMLQAQGPASQTAASQTQNPAAQAQSTPAQRSGEPQEKKTAQANSHLSTATARAGSTQKQPSAAPAVQSARSTAAQPANAEFPPQKAKGGLSGDPDFPPQKAKGGLSGDPDFGPRRADGSFFSNSQANSIATIQDPALKKAAESSAKNAAEQNARNAAEPPVKRGRTISAAEPREAQNRGPQQARSSLAAVEESTKAEVAKLATSEIKATDKPTTEPTVEVVSPRDAAPRDADRAAERKPEQAEPVAGKLPAKKRGQREAEFRAAQPTSGGQRSLVRALGLKVGRIVIDAGHGGHDTGTIGPNGMLEKDLVLDVSLRLGRILENKLGAEVVYTRDDDTFVPLETRTAIANEQQADLFISIHANSSPDPSARGVETYYLNFNPSPEAMEVAARENAVSEKSVHELGDLVKKIATSDKVEESREFAVDVQRSLYVGVGGKENGIRDRGVKKALFIVLLGANMPSILAEISFISNPKDERKLQNPEYRQKIAESLYRGIARYVSGLSGVKMASKAVPPESR